MISNRPHLKNVFFALFAALSLQLVAQDPPDISLVFYLEEHSSNGTVVGTVTGTDPNGDPLTYAIVLGNGTGAFDINSTTGDVFVADESQMNFDQNPSFILGVEANDGNGGITSVEITINLVDIPLGAEDLDLTIIVYPNPVGDLLTIDLQDVELNEPMFSLHSMAGHRLSITPVFLSNKTIEIDLSTIQKGFYLLTISDEQIIRSTRRIFVR